MIIYVEAEEVFPLNGDPAVRSLSLGDRNTGDASEVVYEWVTSRSQMTLNCG